MYRQGPTCLSPAARRYLRGRPEPTHWDRPTDFPDAESFAEAASDSDGVRRELVRRVRAEIAAGSYDTQEKMDLAMERLFLHLHWA